MLPSAGNGPSLPDVSICPDLPPSSPADKSNRIGESAEMPRTRAFTPVTFVVTVSRSSTMRILPSVSCTASMANVGEEAVFDGDGCGDGATGVALAGCSTCFGAGSTAGGRDSSDGSGAASAGCPNKSPMFHAPSRERFSTISG